MSIVEENEYDRQIKERHIDIDSHTAVTFVSQKDEYSIYIFGGFINYNHLSNSIYKIIPCNKRKNHYDMCQVHVNNISAQIPSPRYGHSMVNLGLKSSEFYIFGGVINNNGIRSDEIWKFNFQQGNGEWERIQD